MLLEMFISCQASYARAKVTNSVQKDSDEISIGLCSIYIHTVSTNEKNVVRFILNIDIMK